MMQLTKLEASVFLLNRHGLLKPRSIETKDGILDFIRSLGCIQYDPLNQAGRNADLVLQSRVKNYREEMLFDLLYRDRLLVDYWDKNMSVWPVEAWPYFARYRKGFTAWYGQRESDFSEVYEKIFERLESHENICSSDLSEINRENKTDWSWAPTTILRAALEALFHCGKLVIHNKKGTRKYYTLPERIIPGHLLDQDDMNLTETDFFNWMVKRRILSVGMLPEKASDAWLGIRDFRAENRKLSFKSLEESGEIQKVIVDTDAKDGGGEYYICTENLPYLEAEEHLLKNQSAAVIAPLDNLIWDRRLIKALFNFDYKWEVYTPAKDRKYGYYTLPVICGTSFIARFEPKYERKTRTLHIKNWWWEKDVPFSTDIENALISCFSDFMYFCDADTLHWHGKNKGKMGWLSSLKIRQ